MDNFDINEYLEQLDESADIGNCRKVPFPKIRDDQNYIFISYAHADYKEVYKALAFMYENGVRFWYDRGLTAGKDWETEAKEKIRHPNCSGAIFFLSKNLFLSKSVVHIELPCILGVDENGKKIDGLEALNYFSVNLSENKPGRIIRNALMEAELDTEWIGLLATAFSDKATYISSGEFEYENRLLEQIANNFNVIENNVSRKASALTAQDIIHLLKQSKNLGSTRAEILLDSADSLDVSSFENEDLFLSEEAEKLADGAFLYKLGVYYLGTHPDKSEEYIFKSASLGYSQAQYAVGRRFLLNDNLEEALKWLKKAAVQGDADAKEAFEMLSKQKELLCKRSFSLTGEELFCIAICYKKTQKNFDLYIKYLKKSARAGYSEAQYELGKNYLLGRFVKQNFEKAIRWLGKAAKQLHQEAKKECSQYQKFLYLHGKNEDALNPEELYYVATYCDKIKYQEDSAKYYLLAAEAGSADAQYEVALFFESGFLGFRKDTEMAKFWALKSIAQGHLLATKLYERLCNQSN